MRADIATVDLGFTKFDGLILPDGSYAISVSQIAELMGLDNTQRQLSRDIKSMLGDGFQFGEITNGLNQPVNILTITEFEQLLKALAVIGNEQAQVMLGLHKKGKAKIPSRELKKEIQLSLQASIGGVFEVKTLAGNINLLTADEIIEVKRIKGWKSALGQIIVYGKYYPSHQKRIHLFGETQASYLELIRSHCTPLDVIVTHQSR